MLNARYAEIFDDDTDRARQRERIALDESIRLMETAEQDSSSNVARSGAILFSSKLWSVLMDDLADSRNGLSTELRAQLISIGIWLVKELELLRSDPHRKFTDVLAVSRSIRDGLA